MTYGALRLILSKLHPGVDLELIDHWFMTRYEDHILSGTPWKRLEGEVILQAPDSYATGTVAVTRGSASIVGTGTTWTAAMDGLMLRVNNSSEYYQFTYVNATHATLDRACEQPTASLLAYRIDQPVFVLPTNCRVVRGVRPLHDRGAPLERFTPAELNNLAPFRTTYGTPQYYTPGFDSATNQMQIELYPVASSPNSDGKTLSWAVDCIFDATIDTEDTSATMLPWMSDGAMQNGVSADVCRWRGTLRTDNPLYLANAVTMAADYEARFTAMLKNMGVVNAQQRGSRSMKMAPQFMGRKPPYYRRGPKHEGFTG